ncbi:MAG: hypothetical protein LBN08_06615 [Lactobacillales bacterium]|jgi:hypothetical protein|nr:hypothetical protein [Lactobacillales bacterium]
MAKKNDGFLMVEAMITVIPMIAIIVTSLAIGIIYFRLAALQLSANILSDKVAMSYFTAQAPNKNTGAISSNQEIASTLDVGMFSVLRQWRNVFDADNNAVYQFFYDGQDVRFPDKKDANTFKKPLMNQFGKPINFFSNKETLKCEINLPKQDGIGREHIVVKMTDSFHIPFYGVMAYLGIVPEDPKGHDQFTQTAISVSNSFYPSYAYNTLNFTDYTTHYFERNSEIFKFVDWLISYIEGQ